MTAMDGQFRLFKDVVGKLFEPMEKTKERAGRIFIIASATVGFLMTTIIQQPMVIVLIAVSAGFIYYPLTFALNIYCVTRLVDEKFRPSKLNVILAIIGFCLSIVGVFLFIFVRLL